jgi:hypothetical protein
LLPAWLGYPGKQKPTLGGLVCTFSLTFATFKALSKNTLSENSFDFKIIWFWIFKKNEGMDSANQLEDLVEQNG